MALDTVDYIIFVISVLLSAVISIYYRCTGGKQNSNKEYLLGGKNQSVIPVAFSLVANFSSSIAIFGYTSEVYSFGTHFFVINVAYMISTPVAAAFYLPVLFKNDTVSVYEYFEKRFGKLTRLLTSLAFSTQMVLYMGIVHYAPALAIEAVAGIPQTWSILVVGTFCICYSVIGGMKAVILNDVFQTLLMFAAVYVIIIVNVIDAGGITNIWNAAVAHDRIQFSNFNLDPTERHSWWTVVIGGFFTHIAVYAVNQAQVQRYVSMDSYKNAVYALLLSCPILVLFMSSLCLAGICLFYYYKDCDPVKEGRILLSDQILPLYVMDRLEHLPGLTGLFVAGIFSASLSTVSAAVNSLAAVSLEDYVKPMYKFFKKKELETHNADLSKLLALIYGFVCLVLAMMVRNYESLMQACLVVFGIVGGPMFGLFTLGIMCPFVNQFSALCGFLTGLTFSFVIGFGGPKPKPVPLPTFSHNCSHALTNSTFNSINSQSSLAPTDHFYLFRISYLYYIAMGFLITVVVSALMSSVFGSAISESDEELFTPPVAKYIRRRKRRNENVYMVAR